MSNRLKEMRFFKKKSQMRLQLETGVNASLISRFECGYIQPTKEQMRKLAKALGVSISKLFPPEEPAKGAQSGEKQHSKNKTFSEIENEGRSSVNKI